MIEVVGAFEAPEFLVDGIESIAIIEGVVRVGFYAMRKDERVAVVRLAIPVSSLPDVIQKLVISLTEAVKPIIAPKVSH